MDAESPAKNIENLGLILNLGNSKCKMRLEDEGPAYEVTEGYVITS